MMFRQYVPSPVGLLEVEANEKAVTAVHFVERERKPSKPHPILMRVIRELTEYFVGRRTKFTVPVAPEGTPLQQQIWKAMSRIPLGKTETYGALAKAVGHPRAARAVGSACGKNPIGIIIPCHRVLSSSGLGGYSSGLGKKKWLLRHEGCY